MRTRSILSGLTALAAFALSVPQVPAQQIPAVICNGLIGCGAAPENLIVEGVLPMAAMILIQLVGGLAVLFIVIAGTRMTTTGSEDDAGAAKKAIIYGLMGLGLAIAAAPIVSFIITENYTEAGGDMLLVGVMAAAIRIILTVFNVVLVIVIIYAGITMARSMGAGDDFKKGINMVKWAVIGAIIVNLARAIVQAVLNLNF